MPKKNRIIILSLLTIGLVIGWYFLNQIKEQPISSGKLRKEIYNFDASVCPGETKDWTISDPFTRGTFEEGTTVSVILNYYSCNEMKKGEYVLYRFSEFHDPVVRRVIAVAGDAFELIQKENKTEGWKIKVNGIDITTVDGKEYLFGGELPPPLALAHHQKNGKLGQNEIILLSTWSPGDKDSSIFGVISKNDVIGYIETKTGEQEQ